jgi:threonine aldolase
MSTTTIPTARIFSSDNVAGASPEILDAIARAAVGQAKPYGADDVTGDVRRKLCEIFEYDVDDLLRAVRRHTV